MKLCEMSDTDRYAMREAITDAGGYVAMYDNEAMIVAAPVPFSDFVVAIHKAGLLMDEKISFFPLGTDNPGDRYRHIGPHQKPGDRGGYWLYTRIRRP